MSAAQMFGTQVDTPSENMSDTFFDHWHLLRGETNFAFLLGLHHLESSTRIIISFACRGVAGTNHAASTQPRSAAPNLEIPVQGQDQGKACSREDKTPKP